MSYKTNNPQAVSTALMVAGGVFIIATIFDLVTEFVISSGLYWTWLVFTYLSLIVFIYAISKTGSTFRRASGTLNGASALLVIFIILDLILVLGIFFGWMWLFLSFAGVIILFAASIIRGIAFTVAHVGLNKVGKGVGNPVLVIYGWADLIFLIIYWVTLPPTDDMVLMIGTFVDIGLFLLAGLFLFVSASKVKAKQIQSTTATPQYTPAYPTYQQPQQLTQPYQPPAPQGAPAKGFCSHCGNTISDDDRFCENCGAKLE
jgi:hypothetical protein